MSHFKDKHPAFPNRTVIYTDLPMKKRYLTVKEYNQNSAHLNHLTKEENRPEILNPTALYNLDKYSVGSYASLENTIAIHPQEHTPVNGNADFEFLPLSPETRLKRNMLSKGNDSYRTYLTYSGERDIHGRIGLEKTSQSCNPLYMFQSLINSKKESENLIELNIRD